MTHDPFDPRHLDFTRECRIWLDDREHRFVLLDPEDYDWAIQWRWSAKPDKHGNKFYAVRTLTTGKRHNNTRCHRCLYLHVEVLKRHRPEPPTPPTPAHTMSDHRNGREWDCAERLASIWRNWLMPYKKNHMVARRSSKNSLDDFPTPPWATRAFFHYVVPEFLRASDLIFLEPAAGRGHMARTIKEFVQLVKAADVKDYGRGYKVADYTNGGKYGRYDAMMTNPPYKCANDFVVRALNEARYVAILVRTLWLEGGKDVPTSRWNRILKERPPQRVGLISARMPARKGRVIQKHPVFVSHSWVFWDQMSSQKGTQFIWIPPEAQQLLEKDADYA